MGKASGGSQHPPPSEQTSACDPTISKAQDDSPGQNPEISGDHPSPDGGQTDTESTLVGHNPPEIGGQTGPEPTRYGDWEKNGRCTDF
ncbi:MAG: DUF1674 domain-containing protein [Gammaproteobacteria bacterium]|nr:DUF1674 domain-containing protein [Gammaproteobacteria bacterium]